MLRKLIVGIVLLVLAFSFISVLAQDVTAEVTPVLTATATPGGGGGSSGGILGPDTVGAIFAVLTFLAVGFAAGRYRPGEVARELEKNKAALDSAEKIALNTIPVSALETIRAIVADATDVLRVATKILDGTPNDTPPDEPSVG